MLLHSVLLVVLVVVNFGRIYCLIGVVVKVKASTSRAADARFNSHLHCGDFS